MEFLKAGSLQICCNLRQTVAFLQGDRKFSITATVAIYCHSSCDLRQVWTSLNEEDIKRRWRYRVGNFNILISLRNDIIEAFIIGTPTDVGRRFGWSCLSISGAQWCKTMELFSRVKWRNVSTQNGKLLYLWQTHNAWQHSTLVWLLGWSVCSSPSTKELHGKIFSNYLTHWCLNEPRSVTANKRLKLAFAQLANNFGFWPSCTVSIVLAFH